MYLYMANSSKYIMLEALFYSELCVVCVHNEVPTFYWYMAAETNYSTVMYKNALCAVFFLKMKTQEQHIQSELFMWT